jgi:hypothetical protein
MPTTYVSDYCRLFNDEMSYLRRSARKSKLERFPSEEIRRIMQAEETVLDRRKA